MNKDINNYNSKGQFHGYQKRYVINGLSCKFFYYNGIPINYSEFYYSSGELVKCFYI